MVWTKRAGRAAVALSVAAMLGVSGCGSDPSANGGKAPHGDKPVTSAPSAPPKAEFVSVDASNLVGVTSHTYTDSTRGIEATVPYLKDARTLSSAMEVVREHLLRTSAQEKASGTKITTQVIASAPDAVGILVSATVTGAQGERTNPVVVWYDPVSRRAHSSPVLIDAQQWGAFKNAVTKAAGKGADAKKLSAAMDAEAAPQGTGPALGFDAEGNVVVRFAPGVVGEQAAGFVVPAKEADALLSTFGRAAQAATKSPSKFDATVKPASPAPSSAATPAITASKSATPGNQVPRPSTAVGVDCAKEKCVALTYDDGPGPESHKVVEAFLAEGGAVTFFQLGQMIKANPDQAKLIASSGMEVASHSMTHPDLARSGADKARRELEGSADAMKEVYGRTPMLLRPPYGSHNKAVDEIAAANGMAVIQWNNDTNDWKTKNTMSTEAAASSAKPNAVVLMHDIHDSTVAAAPGIARDLKAKGLTMVTLSELALNSGAYEAGHSYCTITSEKQSGFLCTG
ncbi:hypothetical protein GCM10027418_03730 [Mariniluteicoccus endophyticus]